MPRKRDPEPPVHLIVFLLVAASLAIGGLAHFTAALMGLLSVFAGIAAIGLVILLSLAVIRHRRNGDGQSASASATRVESALRAHTTRERLRHIDWYQFEKVIGRLLTIEGFQVEQLGGAHADGGVDLIARRNGQKILVQCKHWQNWQIKPATVREMVGTLKINGGDHLCIYTLASGTRMAEQLAAQYGIEIVTEWEILSRLQSAGVSRFGDLLDPTQKFCPACESRMILKQAEFPSFWGCSRFPACRGKIEPHRHSVAG